MGKKRLYIPEDKMISADLVLVTISIADELELDPNTTNRTHFGKALIKHFSKKD